MFFNLFRSRDETYALKPKSYDDRNFILRMIDYYKKHVADEEKFARIEQRRVYFIQNAVRALIQEFKDINRYGAQGLSNELEHSLVSLHCKSIRLLLLEKDFFHTLLYHNSLSYLEVIGKEYCGPRLESQKINDNLVYFFKRSAILPEYIFCQSYLRIYSNDRTFDYCKRFIITIRIALEIFITSSFLIQGYRISKRIDKEFFKRISTNEEELQLLLDRSLSIQDFVDYELKREKRLLETFPQDDIRIMIPYELKIEEDPIPGLDSKLTLSSENNSNMSNSSAVTDIFEDSYLEIPPDIEVEQEKTGGPAQLSDLVVDKDDSLEDTNGLSLVIPPRLELDPGPCLPPAPIPAFDFEHSMENDVPQLSKDAEVIRLVEHLRQESHDFNLINIYLSIALYKIFESQEFLYDRNLDLWKLLETNYPHENAFTSTTPQGKYVEVFIQNGILEHSGVSKVTDNVQEIQKLSFDKNNSKVIRRILPRIQDFFS